jgi:ABC-type branched-subunit amino acid transport system ATPase component
MNLVKNLLEKGISIMLIEAHVWAVMGVSDWIVVLNFGEKIGAGTPKEVKTNQQVIDV